MSSIIPLQPIDYLLIGHIAEDITPTSKQLGGTVTFCALMARALGLRVGIVTASTKELHLEVLIDIQVITHASEHTTTFENIYTKEGRKQILHHQAARINYADIPTAWQNTAIIHVAPIAQEVEEEIPASFSTSLLGITPQGWMRTWDSAGNIQACAWRSADTILPRAGAVVVSREDVGGDDELIEHMAQHTKILAVTEGSAGMVLYWNGDRRRFNAPQVDEVDATGAGDIFAASFFIRLNTTRDPWEAARFATLLASQSVTRKGLEGIPNSREIENSLMEVL